MVAMSFSLAEIAEKIGATVVYAQDCVNNNPEVNGLATLSSAQAGQIAFLANSKYRTQLKETQASAVIITEDCLSDCPTHALVMKNPYFGYALVAQLLDTTPASAQEIHPTAVIDPSVTIGNNVAVGANVVIESGVVLGDDVSIGPGCFIGKNANIGSGTKFWTNISIYHNVIIGKNCLIQANTVIGSDGFGYANNQGQWLKIPQLGTVVIGDNVEIGASTTIDRGALENTEIHNGVILDNQIQIAHNVVVGENTAMAACSVIAGSSVIGKNCTIAGLVGINGHIEVTDGCVFTGMSMVTKPIKEPGVYSSGMPCAPNKEWNRSNARIRKLAALNDRVSHLEKELANK
ncbi:UDP-3-O-(3-hydroxymyristoyl)glucosamine N-acyltransferase [Colwelliaceae bacterium 6471]